jgi:iron complex outermembrane receptor protein
VLCPGGDTKAAGNVIAACNYAATLLNRSNSNLKPEKSTSYTAGLILEPVTGWSTTVDYFNIKIKDQIILGAPGTEVRGAPTESVISDGAGGTFLGTPAFGPVIYFPSTYENANSTKVTGVELGSSYKFKLKEYGSLTVAAQFTHMISYVLTTADGQYQLAGTHGPSGTSGNTGNPKDRATVNVTWDRGPLQLSTSVNYISSFDLTDPSVGTNTCSDGAAYGLYFPDGNPPSNLCKVAAFVSTDLAARYKLNKGWTLHGSVTNLFKRQPPVDINTYGNAQLPYNPSLHSVGAVGRFINVGASYEF